MRKEGKMKERLEKGGKIREAKDVNRPKQSIGRGGMEISESRDVLRVGEGEEMTRRGRKMGEVTRK